MPQSTSKLKNIFFIAGNALSHLWESCPTCFVLLMNCVGACVRSNLLSSCYSAGEEIPQ